MVSPLLLLFLFKRSECESIWGKQKKQHLVREIRHQKSHHEQRNSSESRRFGQTLAHLTGGLFPVSRVGTRQEVDTIAGTGERVMNPKASGAALPQKPVNNPYGVVPGPDGALYFCEVDTGRIRRIDLNNLRLSTIAGTGEPLSQ